MNKYGVPGWRRHLMVAGLLGALALAGGCRDADPPPSVMNAPSAAPFATEVLMPDLIGRSSRDAGQVLGELDLVRQWEITPSWERPVAVRCEMRPGEVARQRPSPGTPLTRGQTVRIRLASLDLAQFRGPCEASDGDLGPVKGPDAALARQFYRFAAEPSLGATFAPGPTWIGLGDGAAGKRIDAAARSDLAAWRFDVLYAEATGPFSALDVLASSGGYYQLDNGVLPTCPGQKVWVPPEMSGTRALTLSQPWDSIDSCMWWWAVTLFLDNDDRIRGVLLLHGAP